MRLLFSLYATRAGGLLLALLLSCMTLAAGVALFGVSGWFLTGAALATSAMTFNLFGPSAMVRGFSFLRIVSRYGERLAGHATTFKILSDIRVRVFSRLIPLVPLKAAAHRTGDFVARLTADVETLDMMFLQVVAPVATAILGALGLGLFLWLVLPEALPVALVGFGLTTLFVPLMIGLAGRHTGAATVRTAADLRVAVLDGIDGHADLVTLGAVDGARRTVDDAAAALRRTRLRQSWRIAFGPAFVVLGTGVTAIATLFVGLPVLEQGRVTGPVLVGALLAVMAVFEVAGPILRGAGRLGAASAAAGRVQSLVDMQPGIVDPANPVAIPPTGDITFEKVGFTYGRDQSILAGLNLTLHPGERIAILGESGSGKSTLLGLLLRLMDVDSGRIQIGGIDIRRLAQTDLHGHVALLSQDAPVFIGTIRDNLRIADPAADDAMLHIVLEKARLDDFVRALPQGLDTWLGESGETLSAGQARRLCLARTLLSPAPVLLLDEPTAGLDRPTEAEFLADLLAVTTGRTLILATHAAIPPGAVDRIYRLEGGVLTPVG
ncbi:thiol reductant ABC exporter subunit CydC [Kaistia defluvii]|uniref:thiol reductant ABC exporter subunit CydC n=1 Tax=Kaistia defluvii TaxID=410841 RepID=UPI0022568B20|nr:thiol reductant ABC exporter subunit CydC [Kaistia defluvii]MCX5519227.1 thiol reductant ABC exporter subunit CydC [Kaistia defluvii]